MHPLSRKLFQAGAGLWCRRAGAVVLQSEPCAELQSLCRSASGRADLLLLLLLVQCLGKGNFCSPPSGTSTPLSSPQPSPGTPPSPPPALWGSIPGRPAEQCDPAALTALRSPLLASCGARPRPRPPRPQRGLPPASSGGFWGCPSSGLPSPQPPPRFPLRAPGVRAPEPAGAIAFPRPPGVQRGMLSAAFALPTRAQVVFLSFYFYFYFFLEAPMSLVLAVRGVIAQPQSTKIHLDANAWWQLGVSIHKNTGF